VCSRILEIQAAESGALPGTVRRDKGGSLEKLLSLFGTDHVALDWWRRRLGRIVVDDLHDAGARGMELLRLLSGGRNNLFAAADDGGSTYRSPGASDLWRNLFDTAFPGAAVFTLTGNRRATRQLAAVIDSLSGEGVSPVRAGADGGSGEPVTVYLAIDGRGEAVFVAGEIARRWRAGAEPREFAVIVRGASEAQAVAERLAALSIEHGSAPVLEGHGAGSIMTAAECVGLEFPVVFITGCDESVAPAGTGGGEAERRLYALAASRASRKLCFTHALQRTFDGVQENRRPSGCLANLPGVERSKQAGVAEAVAVRDGGVRAKDRPVLTPMQGGGGIKRARHAKFGMGIVKGEHGSGDSRMLFVEFPGLGTKKILARFLEIAE
jgi:superfamily I DNA/RNA helicase